MAVEGTPGACSAAEEKFTRSTEDTSQLTLELHRVQAADAARHRLLGGGPVNPFFVVKLLQKNHY